MPRRNNPEYELHKTVIAWLGYVKPNCLYFHPYNGAWMSKATAGKGKTLGVLPGVADLVFVLPGGKVGFIELKAPKGKHTEAQNTFRDNVWDLGAEYFTGRSIEDVQYALTQWGVRFTGIAHTRGRAA